jgi:hypothetical protein
VTADDSTSEPVRLTNGEEILYRQVHPTQIVHGEPNKEAFNPSPRDELKLSTLREHVGPEEAHRRWTQDLGKQSAGTFGVTVKEIDGTEITNGQTGSSARLHAIDDAAASRVPDHASVVFSALPSKGQRTQAARKLRDLAVERGCLHP